MKKQLINQTDRDGFLAFVEAIKNAENDKDLFLAAARLQRQERQPRPFKETLLLVLIPCLVALLAAILALGWLSGQFVPALVGAGLIAFIALMGGMGMA